MDIREPVAKMRAEAEQKRKQATQIEEDAARFMAEARANYDAQILTANNLHEEAAYWDGLASREEQALRLPDPAGETLRDQEVTP